MKICTGVTPGLWNLCVSNKVVVGFYLRLRELKLQVCEDTGSSLEQGKKV
jgi:hypothetical protein